MVKFTFVLPVNANEQYSFILLKSCSTPAVLYCKACITSKPNIMKKLSILLFTAVNVLLLLSLAHCKKNNNTTAYAVEEWPQNWVLVIDRNDPLFYKVLTADGVPVLRSDVGKDNFNAAQYAVSHSCKWIAELRGDPGSGRVSLKLANDTTLYMTGVVNRLATEYMLVVTTTPYTTPGNTEWLFKMNRLSSVNGKKRITLESVAYPGYFVSNEPPLGTGNGIKLLSDPEPLICY